MPFVTVLVKLVYTCFKRRRETKNSIYDIEQGYDASSDIKTLSNAPTADVGVQTVPTSISRFPVDCHSHVVSWGLGTDQPSPLAVHNITVDHSYNHNKRTLEDMTSLEYSTCPPTKIPALEDQDYINPDVIVTETPVRCEYEGVVDADISNIGIRSIATNTMHVPIQRAPTKCIRSNAWSQAAKQYLSVKDRADKRGPRKGTQKQKTQRMNKAMTAYYCRLDW